MVGYVHSNGKYKKFYEKYRCRTCNRYWHKDEIHDKIIDLFNRYEMSGDTQTKIISALDTVWIKDRENRASEVKSLLSAISSLDQDIEQKV